jgi:hypothetical protein
MQHICTDALVTSCSAGRQPALSASGTSVVLVACSPLSGWLAIVASAVHNLMLAGLACMASPLGVPGDLRAVSWSSFALRSAFAFTGVRIRLNQAFYIIVGSQLGETSAVPKLARVCSLAWLACCKLVIGACSLLYR